MIHAYILSLCTLSLEQLEILFLAFWLFIFPDSFFDFYLSWHLNFDLDGF